ncbi:MAG: recombinase family protein [Pseudomonadota bacterium]
MLIGYARVSTVDQNPQAQLDALREAGCHELFEEKASGSKAERPQLAAALRHARKGDTLVVWKLDRLARSMRQLLDITHQLEEREIGLRSITEAIDTTTPGGMLVFHIFGAMAEFERSLIVERTHAGLSAARAMGRTGGRRRVLTAEKEKQARALIAGGMGVREAGEAVGVSKATLHRAGITAQKVRSCS